MALNEAWRAALKALSYPDIDLTKNYKLWRAFQDAAPALISKISGSARDIEIAGVPVRVFTPDEGARRPRCRSIGADASPGRRSSSTPSRSRTLRRIRLFPPCGKTAPITC